MENRWSFKDVFVVALLVAIIASVWIAMKQFDRQWEDVKSLKTQVGQLTSEQARTLDQVKELRQAFDSRPTAPVGPATTNNNNPPEKAAPDAHARLRKVRDAKDYARGDWMIDAFAANVAKITPHTYKDLYGRRIQDHVLEGLIEIDPQTLEPNPKIASGWQVSEDGLTITFQLRKDVVFSDGHPLTAEDVLFSLELLQNPNLDNPSERQFYDTIASCTATNPYEVVFKMKEPHYMALTMAGNRNVLPKHFYSKFTIAEINKHPGLLMGTGPYRMPDPEAWTPGKLIELVRNERYWGPAPAFDKLIWREIDNDVTRLTNFRNGEIDLFVAQPNQFDELKADKQITERAVAMNYDTVPTGYMFIAWQQKRDGKATIFADKRVRQAMTFLTDRQGICDIVMLKYATPASGPFAPGSKQENAAIKPMPYDIEKGKALLKEAGWEDRNKDGVIENAAGEPFKFKFTYPSGSVLYDRIMLYIKDSYAKVGVVMELEPLEWSVFAERLENQTFDAVTLRWGGGAVEADIRQMFHSSQVEKGSDNFMNYINPELDKIIDEARRTVSPAEKRYKLWHQAHAILAEDQPYTFMFTAQALRFVDKRIRNIERVTQGINERWEWYTPSTMQKWK